MENLEEIRKEYRVSRWRLAGWYWREKWFRVYLRSVAIPNRRRVWIC